MYINSEFEMREYIKKRMLEIRGLEDRNLFKEVVRDLLLQIYEYNQTAYTELENKVLAETGFVQNLYTIYMSMTDRKHYDATDTFLHPMLERDTKNSEIQFQDIAAAMKGKKDYKLYTVFYKASATKVYELINKERTFTGVVKTLKNEFPATFYIKQNAEYLDMIKDLYYIFGSNHLSWSTICEAYLAKMFDVYLCSSELFKGMDTIVEIKVDFEEYSPLLYSDMIPLWNLQPLSEKTSTYTSPCIDKINFEHKIFSHRLKNDCQYLVRNSNVEITNIRRIQGDLIITCPLETGCDWQLYQVTKGKGSETYLFPVLSNEYKESFSGAITEMFRKSIKTKGELARLVESFQYNSYVEFRDIHIMDSIPAHCIKSNYNMDGFIQDEIRGGNRQALVIDFIPTNSDDYLSEDIMSFLVTQIQKLFPEYDCVGRLI